LLHGWTEDTRRQLAGTIEDAKAFREVVGGAVEVLMGRTLAEAGPAMWQPVSAADSGNYRQIAGLLQNRARGEELPVLRIEPKNWNGVTVIWVDEAGKAGLFEPGDDGNTGLRTGIRQFVDQGIEVMGVDLLYQGEFLEPGEPVVETRRVGNPRESAAYTLGYNHSLFAQRVHDLLTTIRYLREREPQPRRLYMIGLAGAGPWVAAARAVSGDAIARMAIDTGGFRFGRLRELRDVNFLPGGANYFDLPGMIALGAPGDLFLGGETEDLTQVVDRMYRSVDAGDRVTRYAGAAEGFSQAAVAWLLRDN
jgi:hypothetical protein